MFNLLFLVFGVVGICSCGLTIPEIELAEETVVEVIEEAEKLQKAY